MIKRILFVLFLLSTFAINAQNSSVQMADTFYAEGKIYVVIAVFSVILIGLIAYLIYIDRKVAAIEKEILDK